MKLQQSFKKSLANIAVFILGVFAVVGLSYAAAPNNNTFKPINEGSDIQGRCVTQNTAKALDPNHMYSGDNKCISASTLITNGLFVKTPKTTFEIQGDPGSSNTTYRNGAFYVGCSTDANLLPDSAVRSNCTKNSSAEAYLNGDVYIYELADSSATTDRKICISSAGVVKLCP